MVARTSLRATLEREAPKGPNPVALTDENLVAGFLLYGEHCAICHGTAKADASASPVGKGLYPQPPQLATDGVEDDPEGVRSGRSSTQREPVQRAGLSAQSLRGIHDADCGEGHSIKLTCAAGLAPFECACAKQRPIKPIC